ncbi:MAG: DNA primase [Pseudomonadota bacterium]
MPRFTPEFLDELKSRIRPSDLIGRTVKLKKQGNEFAGLSPFTTEKTPSFFVNDKKGFYHCFSSGRHGDVIKFLQETQNLPFHEAVARLAEDVGMELPKDTPQQAEAAKQRKGLYEACAAAADFFAAMLTRQPGRHASAYLDRRGITPEQRKGFKIGYAPAERTALKDYLINKDFDEKTLVDAGLIIKPEDGGRTYDRFRDRVMFPIAGSNGKIIAFGGRALDKAARAKYLNSPETPIFHKGAQLYNYGQARAAISNSSDSLIVCEGYMDVIALWGVGVKNAVAPLGTAMTERQLGLLWSACDEPVLCFDGDRAGRQAAHRAIDRALPLLKPGKSLKFVFMPDGQDPDDLAREGGAAAVSKAFSNPAPLDKALWEREFEAQPLDTPERRAGFKSRMRTLVREIADQDVRAAYGDALRVRFDEAFGSPPSGPAPRPFSPPSGQKQNPFYRKGSGPGSFMDPKPLPETRNRTLQQKWRREALLVAAILHQPVLIERCEDEIFRFAPSDPGLDALLAALLHQFSAIGRVDIALLRHQLTNNVAVAALQRISEDAMLTRQGLLAPDADTDFVVSAWQEAYARHEAIQAESEVRDAASGCLSENGEEIWRAAVRARDTFAAQRHVSGASEDTGEGDLSQSLEELRAGVQSRRAKGQR